MIELPKIGINKKQENIDKKETEKLPFVCDNCGKNESQTYKRKSNHIYRKAYSELQLFEKLESNFQEGYSYHCLSGGDIDSLTFIKHILKQQSLEYLLFSTWCMAIDDILLMKEWLESGIVKKIDAYCGEIFKGSYSKEYALLKEVIGKHNGMVCIFRNHSKVYAGYGEKFYFGIESSANINTNPRTENTTIHIGKDIYNFYKDFYSGIKNFEKQIKN